MTNKIKSLQPSNRIPKDTDKEFYTFKYKEINTLKKIKEIEVLCGIIWAPGELESVVTDHCGVNHTKQNTHRVREMRILNDHHFEIFDRIGVKGRRLMTGLNSYFDINPWVGTHISTTATVAALRKLTKLATKEITEVIDNVAKIVDGNTNLLHFATDLGTPKRVFIGDDYLASWKVYDFNGTNNNPIFKATGDIGELANPRTPKPKLTPDNETVVYDKVTKKYVVVVYEDGYPSNVLFVNKKELRLFNKKSADCVYVGTWPNGVLDDDVSTALFTYYREDIKPGDADAGTLPFYTVLELY